MIELQYCPTIPFFREAVQASVVHIEAQENYSKRSFRNRTQILTANGVQRLSIPLRKGKNEQMSIREVQIANEENWQNKHWRAIKTAYSKAPFFPYYADDLAPFYEKKMSFLYDWNWDLLKLLTDLLGLEISWKESLEFNIPAPQGVLDLRNSIHPKQADLQSPHHPYAQVFREKHGFIPNMSILDLLFCTGPEAISYLSSER